MQLLPRLLAMERQLGRGTVCPACGHQAGVPVQFAIRWAHEAPDTGPERCPTCGRRLRIQLHWPDERALSEQDHDEDQHGRA
jgi:hypothetical protein